MAVSIFYAQKDCNIDAVNTGYNGDNFYQAGVVRVGGAKTFEFNQLETFDLNTADSGPALPAAFTVDSAELWGNTYSLVTTNPANYNLNRLDDPHAAYDDASATWLLWKTANAWTVGGGDFVTTPPTLSYIGPTSLGDARIVAGLGPLVLDAVASRGGMLHLLHQQIPLIAAPDSSSYVVKPGNPGVSDSARIIVTWHDPSLDQPNIDHPQRDTLRGVRPIPGAPASAGAPPAAPARPPHPTRRP